MSMIYSISLLLLLLGTGDGFLHQAVRIRRKSCSTLPFSISNRVNIINVNINTHISGHQKYAGTAQSSSSSLPSLPQLPSLASSSSSSRLVQRLYGKSDDENINDDSVRNLVEKTDIENESNVLIKQWKSLSPENKEDIRTTSISFVVALFIRCFIIEPRFIPSLSMFPTFDVGDQLLVDKVTRMKEYQRRDVVVFNPSQTYIELTGNKEALIKRIVGVGGDSIEIKDSRVYVNGVEQDEPYVNEKPDYELPVMKVPPGYLLVLGDNRNHSFDSHIWGFLPSENVIGRAVVKYWPPWRVGLVE